MKIVLITLSGDAEIARHVLDARYPGAEIATLPRAVLESGGLFGRLSALRAERTDMFAVMTEAIDWQYGRNALMLFGALGGARESLILDSRGNLRAEFWMQLILGAPFRILADLARGWFGVRRARRRLTRLETEIRSDTDRPEVIQRPSDQQVSIAYLRTTPAAGTEAGGASTHILGVVSALIKCGANITFISNDEIAGLGKGELTFRVVPPEQDAMPRSAFEICNSMAFADTSTDVIASKIPDFIYERYSRFSYAGVEAASRAGVPLFLEYNGSEVWMAKHWGRGQLGDVLERCERLDLAAATRVFVVAEVEKQNLISAGVDAAKIVVNPNGVDTAKFQPGIGGAAVRQEFGLTDHDTLAGFLGTFGPWHGVLTLAEAIAHLPADSSLRFLFVGSGTLRGEAEQIVKAAGREDKVIFAGHVEHDRVPALLDACDILLSPHVPLADGSEFFGSPTKLFEYMAMGKAIVASRLGQIGEVLTEGETALLVEPGDAEELGQAIERLANDAALRSRLGTAARAAAIAKHTWQINALRVLQEFKDLPI